MFNLTTKEEQVMLELNSFSKIQDFVNKLEPNFELDGETCMSPRKVLASGKAHCIEGAFFAAACIWLNDLGKPFVVDLKGTQDDCDHVIAVFKKKGKWGCISKTNHAVLRYREPIYRDIRELVMSFFHEYTDTVNKGKKTLRSYSELFDLSLFGEEWITSEEDLWHLHDYLEGLKHFNILDEEQEKNLRVADDIEIKAGNLVEVERKKY